MSDLEGIYTEFMRVNAGKLFLTKCLGCGRPYRETLSWFETRKYRCPGCDGTLDDTFLQKLVYGVLRKSKRAEKPVPKEKRFPAPEATIDRAEKSTDYQLVLQFSGDSEEDLDAVVDLEDQLMEALGETAEVDGHDIGSGQTNIFIFTSDPQGTFEAARPLLQKAPGFQRLIAAYREAGGEDYTVIWPSGSKKTFEVL